MKTFTLIALVLALPLSARAETLNEGRCFDLKQSVVEGLKGSCIGEEKEKLSARIEAFEKKCSQPQLAALLRKSLSERVKKNSIVGCPAPGAKTASL